jgi:putative lipoprotein
MRRQRARLERLTGLAPGLALAAMAGCAGIAQPPEHAAAEPVTGAQAIEGSASYRERMALPPGSEFEAVLQDVSRADAPAMEIARATIQDAPNPPIRFTIAYDPAKIDASHAYAVRAVIRAEGKLLFTSDTSHAVLTRGAGHSVDILLKLAASPPAADAELLDTTWKILAMAGEPVHVLGGKREPQIVLKSADGRDGWSATVGCNQMSGGFSLSGNRVTFKAGMSTLMACPPPLDMLEKQLGKSLLASTQWRIQGNRLELRDEAGVQTFLCEAVHPG